jgi:hypothetical protein
MKEYNERKDRIKSISEQQQDKFEVAGARRVWQIIVRKDIPKFHRIY